MKLAQSLLREELIVFEEKFREAVKSQTPLLDRIMRFIVNRKGKQLRPMFVFLSARLCGPVNESTYRAASLVELLHTATLVHDDVVDESLERRGFFFDLRPVEKQKYRCWWEIIYSPKACSSPWITATSEFYNCCPQRFAK